MHLAHIPRNVRTNVTTALLLIALAVVTAPTWLQWAEPSPLTYKIPYQVTNAPVQAGNLLTFVVSRCNSSGEAVSVYVTRALITTDRTTSYAMGTGANVILPGCMTIQSQNVEVPSYIPTGEYVLENIVNYSGRWREFRTRTYTVPFRVIAP